MELIALGISESLREEREREERIAAEQKQYADWRARCVGKPPTHRIENAMIWRFTFHTLLEESVPGLAETGLLELVIKKGGGTATVWLYEQTSPATFARCKQELRPFRAVSLLVWPPADQPAAAIYVHDIEFHHLPTSVKITVGYSDNGSYSARVDSPPLIHDALQLLRAFGSKTNNPQLVQRMEHDMEVMCLECGGAATRPCSVNDCAARLCDLCDHVHSREEK